MLELSTTSTPTLLQMHWEATRLLEEINAELERRLQDIRDRRPPEVSNEEEV